ncbi:MAG: agmatine deiminase family protein, partial [Anaerolineales bacterium]|nr:agmatine deiminase family protein [Anaerolineales bacterium]MDW8447091.1 agmatine deiminase family protein [Anaerolineales bacterium]
MVYTLPSTPRRDGFYMPAEFAPHKQTWMLWPERPDNWRLGAKPAQRAFVAVAQAIAQFEPVVMGVNPRQFLNARAMLPPEIRVVEVSNNDAWMRDVGPTFVIDGKGNVRLVDWKFNAWGGIKEGLYFPWDLDDLVPRKVAEIEGI